ncbi:agouti-related protein [Clupea harengus]|uniref:Agouti-related protein n=1 Tax=Clupea harengus TaxID=7950 RepID=A0A6P8F7Q4_CLUHA|nr:agouti-related protein [Clupea harengus]
MPNPVKHCWWMLIMIHQTIGGVRTNRMEDSNLRMMEAALLSNLGKDALSRLDPIHLGIESVEEQMMDEPGSYDEFPQYAGQAVQLQSRSTKAPRRCIPHQQSCLGHQFPCCDACDTCYCRFFKAYCYCRSMDPTCTHGRP